MTEAESFRYFLGNAKAIECLQNALVFVGSRLKFVLVAGFHVGLAAGDFAFLIGVHDGGVHEARAFRYAAFDDAADS